MKISKIILVVALISTSIIRANPARKYSTENDAVCGTSDNISSEKMFTPDAKVVMGSGSKIRETVETLKSCAQSDKNKRLAREGNRACVDEPCANLANPNVLISQLNNELRSLQRRRDDIDFAIAKVKCKLDKIQEEVADDL